MKKFFGLIVLFSIFSCTSNNKNGKPPSQQEVKEVADQTVVNDAPNANEEPDTRVFAKTPPKLEAFKLKQNGSDAGFKNITFGFNLGYLGDMNNGMDYSKPLKTIKQDGVNNLRTYEPFTKNLMQDPKLKTRIISGLTNQGFQVLIGLSDFPFPGNGQQLADQDQSKKEMLGYTNRFAPANLDDYGNDLTSFLEDIKTNGAMDHVKFEIGNEPDSKKFFWGTPGEFIRVARKAKSILVKYNRPIYCCAFTSEFANSGVKNQQYQDFLQDNSFFRNIDVSFHFYQNNKFNFNTISIPNVSNAAITEFNLFSYQKGSLKNERSASTNSPYFGSWLIQLLDYSYDHDIKAVYLFKLMDNPNKDGSLGFFDVNGDPKPSYDYFKKIYSIVKDGYKIQKDNQTIQVIGHTQKAIYSLINNLSISSVKNTAKANPSVAARAAVDNSKSSQTMQKGDWVIVNK